MTAVFNHAFEKKELLISQCLAIIVLLFKKGNKQLLGNYRPILLTNTDYKILTYVLTGRLTTHLPDLISLQQTAYMKGRFIGTNIRSVQDMIDHSATHNTDTVVLFLDFKKAFDSVSHVFLEHLLLHIGLPQSYVSWVKLIYSNAHTVAQHKNWLTETFDMNRGVRQGCPLSCHLLNLIGQVLVFSLRQAGFFAYWGKPSDPCSLYADDIVLFIENVSHIPSIINHINIVRTYTGLSLNLDKTIAFCHKQKIDLDVGGILLRNAPVKYLGVFLGCGDLTSMNFKKPLQAVMIHFFIYQ